MMKDSNENSKFTNEIEFLIYPSLINPARKT